MMLQGRIFSKLRSWQRVLMETSSLKLTPSVPLIVMTMLWKVIPTQKKQPRQMAAAVGVVEDSSEAGIIRANSAEKRIRWEGMVVTHTQLYCPMEIYGLNHSIARNIAGSLSTIQLWEDLQPRLLPSRIMWESLMER